MNKEAEKYQKKREESLQIIKKVDALSEQDSIVRKPEINMMASDGIGRGDSLRKSRTPLRSNISK